MPNTPFHLTPASLPAVARPAQVNGSVSEHLKIPHRLSDFSVGEAERWSEDLEAMLLELGLSIASGSELERMCLAPTEILNYKPGQGLASVEAHRQFLDTAALAELATRLLSVRDHPSFPGLLPHLELLNEGDPRQAGRARATDQAARKLFELFTALLAMRFADSVELEHPVHGSRDNPDVVLRYRGKLWGLACKVPTSESPESLIQNLSKAVDQVVASGVDAGFPMFNLKNLISPESYWHSVDDDPDRRRFLVVPRPTQLLNRSLEDVRDLWRGVEQYVGAGVFADVLSPRPCVPAILSYLHVIAPVMHDSFTAATTSRFVSCYHVGRHLLSDEVLADAMHASAIADETQRSAR